MSQSLTNRKGKESSAHSVDFERIRQLTLRGELTDAQKEVERLHRIGKLSTKDSLTLRNLESSILNESGRFQDALVLAKQVLQESEKTGEDPQAIDAIISIATSLYRLGRLTELLQILERGEEALSKTTELEPSEVLLKQAALRSRKGARCLTAL